jgi:hypothetical protein
MPDDNDTNRRVWGSVQIKDETLRLRALRADAIDVAGAFFDADSGEQGKIIPLADQIVAFIESGTVPAQDDGKKAKASLSLINR